ncbi:MAG: DoxX family protein [Parcubacteria group bacterium]
MNKYNKLLVVLRVSIGWIFLYAGIAKILDSEWTSAGYLEHAQTFPSLFNWFASPGNIGWIDFINQWAPLLIGIALILGIGMRWASWSGIALMVLYYVPVLHFPYVGEHSFLIDEHVIYSLVLLVLYYGKAGDHFSLASLISKKSS